MNNHWLDMITQIWFFFLAVYSQAGEINFITDASHSLTNSKSVNRWTDLTPTIRCLMSGNLFSISWRWHSHSKVSVSRCCLNGGLSYVPDIVRVTFLRLNPPQRLTGHTVLQIIQICNLPRLWILERRRLHNGFLIAGCMLASHCWSLRHWRSLQHSTLKELSSLEFRCPVHMVSQSSNVHEVKHLTNCFRIS
jgi:hypothetical protein